MANSEGKWQPIWVRGGKIEQVAWIGKEILAWSSGLYIIFFNITQKRESLRWFSNDENIDGICCLSGHPTMSLLAFSDKAFVDPKIRILSYPTMDQISECVGGSKRGYLATAFTPTDYVISLSSHPAYYLTIWAWRTGERLLSIGTSIRDMEDQIIRVTYTKPVLIAQLGQVSGQLHIWEMSPAGKKLILTNHEVNLPKQALAHHMAWSSESGESLLAIVDKMSHIYISNHDGSNVYRIVLTQRCGICLEYELPAVCWFRGGILLRTTFCQVRFYRKDQKNFWHKEWYVKSVLKPRILSVHPSKNDKLFYHTQEGYLMELEVIDGQNNPTIERRMHYGGIYSFAELVRPWGHHLVAIDDPLEVAVLDSYDGKQVARVDLELEGEVIQISSHPDLPMAAITSKQGELAILSLRDPENPFIIGKFRLQRERLDLIKFSQSGRNLVVGQRTSGICYCISLTKNKPFTVIARLNTECRMADVVFYDHGGHMKLLVVVVSSRRVPVGRHLAVYDVQPSKRDCVEATSYLELPCAYQFLHYAPQGHGLIGTPYLSRQIHLLEIKDWKQVNLVEVMGSGHQVRRPRLFTDRHWIISAAFDGLIEIRSGIDRKVIASLTTHHRKDLGVVKAFVQASGNIIVSLGYNGSLVGLKFVEQDDSTDAELFVNNCRHNFEEYEKKKMEIFNDYTSLEPGIMEMLSKRVEGFPPVKEGVDQTWFEWNEEAKLLAEAEESSELRQSLKHDFVELQKRLIALLNENEASPEIERLPISAFDLDKSTRDQRLKSAREEVEDTQLELEYNCASMERITGWIKRTFWDRQKIVGQSIFSIFGNEQVTNYSDEGDTPDVEDMLRLARLYWNSDTNPSDEESSKLYTWSKLQRALPKRQQKFNSTDERRRIDALLGDDDEEEHEIDPLELEDQLVKEGMTTYRFVETPNHYSSQFEGFTYPQLLLEGHWIANDVQRLRDYFNKLFIEMLEIKERKMNLVREKYKRIRYIDSELMIICGQSVVPILVDPDWNYEESPENIVRVLDDEVKVEPYVSASQQELRNREAEEAERLRKILLADDFREKALMKMMDGVLEVRWEDIIKIDVRKPSCMLSKDPEEYNAEDLLAVRQYEKDVDHLNQERLRYRRLLEAEFTKISESVKEVIEKFNSRLEEFLIIKIKVESAISQLNLRGLRNWIRHMYRIKFMREDDEIRERISIKQKILTKLGEEIRSLQGIAEEYRNQYESLITKERTVEKKFRGDFPDLRRIFVETLEKEYKRRPRMILKNATASDFFELAKIAVSHNKNVYLSHESSEYLKQIEILDIRPAGLPQIIENHHWEHLIKIRRNKIELEMKMKAQMAQIQETEKTITEHNEKIDKCNNDIDSLKDQLKKAKEERIEFDSDVEIQLIVKMGQVEVHPSGRRNDMANAIFLPQKEIDAVNVLIRNAGKKKIATMNHYINYRRGILFREWEHKCRKMTLVELAEELSLIESLLVTREIREYLKRLAKGYKDDKSPQQLQKEMEMTKKSCEKRLEESLLRLEELEDKINKTRKDNEKMDKKIETMNVDRWEMEWQRDLDGQSKQKEYHDRRMAVLVKRSRLVRILQKEYTELLAMQTEQELLRLRRFPTLGCFRTLDDERKKKNAC